VEVQRRVGSRTKRGREACIPRVPELRLIDAKKENRAKALIKRRAIAECGRNNIKKRAHFPAKGNDADGKKKPARRQRRHRDVGLEFGREVLKVPERAAALAGKENREGKEVGVEGKRL